MMRLSAMMRLILLLINTQVSRLRKSFANGSTASTKFSRTQLSKMIQLGRFLVKILAPLIKIDSTLIGHVLKLIAKSVWVPLVLTTVVSATDAAIQKKIFGSGTTALIISKDGSQGGFLGMLLGTLTASLLGSVLTC